MPKYPFSDVCPRGSSAVSIFSNSEKSEFDPGQQFSNNSEIQKFLNYLGGGRGGRPNWEFFSIFLYKNSDATPHYA